MDCHQLSGTIGGELVEKNRFGNPEKGACKNAEPKPVDHVVSATKSGICDRDTYSDPNPNSKGRERQFQLEVGSESPTKRVRNSVSLDFLSSNPSDATGKMFCSYPMSYCAHSSKEFREALPNWQKIVPSVKEEREGSSETRDLLQIPVAELTPNRQASWSKRPCLMIFKEGCQNGVNCPFSHGECFRERESEAIYLHPSTDGDSVYKTRMCNNWVETGRCRYGLKCRYAHGAAELRSNKYVPATPQGTAKAPVATNAPIASVPVPSHTRATAQSLAKITPKTGEISIRKWKGPDKISKIYGDWIDDL